MFGRGPSPAAGKYWLSQKRKKWLLVLDNIDNDDADVMSMVPTGNYGHILITTRRQNLEIYATSGTLRLTRMDPDEAIDLLLRSAYPESEETRSEAQHRSTARKIAERLDFLALALHQAGSAIRRKFYTLDDYLSLYLRQRGRLGSISRSETIDREDVTTTWEIPFERIERREKSFHDDAVALIHIFAFLHHQGIYEWMLHMPSTLHKSELSSTNKLPSILHQSTETKDLIGTRVRAALNVLYDYSLIEFVASTGSCYLHPVIRDWIVSRIQKKGSEEMAYWLRCTSFLLASCGSTKVALPEGTSVNILVPHIDDFLRSVKDFDQQLMYTPPESRQLEKIASIYERAGRWSSALEHLIPLIEYRKRTLGQLHGDTIGTKRLASLCHWNLFDVAATVELQREICQACWISRPSWIDWSRPLKPNHTEYLRALSDLTQTCWLAGRLDLSRMTGELAISRMKERFRVDDTLTINTIFHLARTYRHLGLLDQAHEMLTFVYRERKKTLGATHLDTLMAKNEVGMSWCGRGEKARLPVAEFLVKDVLKQRRAILGKEHAYTLWSVNDVAKVLFLRGRFHESIQYLEEIVPAVIRTLGENHIGMRMTKSNLAQAYAKSGRWGDADQCLLQIIPGIHEDDPDWIRSKIGHARIQIRLNKLAEAEDTCQSVLARLATPEQSLLTKLRSLTWINILLNLRGFKQDTSAGTRVRQQATAGLLAEVFERRGNREGLEELRHRYPDLDEDTLEKEFEIL